jgi:hypothetical protein
VEVNFILFLCGVIVLVTWNIVRQTRNEENEFASSHAVTVGFAYDVEANTYPQHDWFRSFISQSRLVSNELFTAYSLFTSPALFIMRDAWCEVAKILFTRDHLRSSPTGTHDVRTVVRAPSLLTDCNRYYSVHIIRTSVWMTQNTRHLCCRLVLIGPNGTYSTVSESILFSCRRRINSLAYRSLDEWVSLWVTSHSLMVAVPSTSTIFSNMYFELVHVRTRTSTSLQQSAINRPHLIAYVILLPPS